MGLFWRLWALDVAAMIRKQIEVAKRIPICSTHYFIKNIEQISLTLIRTTINWMMWEDDTIIFHSIWAANEMQESHMWLNVENGLDVCRALVMVVGY